MINKLITEMNAQSSRNTMKKNDLRVALCISGQPRSFTEAFPYIKKHIIDLYSPNIDVFLHCWYSPTEVGKQFTNTSDTTREEGINIVESDIPNKIKKLYKPTAVLAEEPENFDYLIKPEYLSARDKTNPLATFSMWTSIQRCNNLKTEYEQKNNFKYDIVIRCRYDIKLETDLLLIQDKKMHSSGHSANKEIIEDIIFYAPSSLMDIICLLPQELDNHFNSILHWNNEKLLHSHCMTHNIPVVRHPDWIFSLLRGQRTIMDSMWYFFRKLRVKLKL